jgi:hypothetical protein
VPLTRFGDVLKGAQPGEVKVVFQLSSSDDMLVSQASDDHSYAASNPSGLEN